MIRRGGYVRFSGWDRGCSGFRVGNETKQNIYNLDGSWAYRGAARDDRGHPEPYALNPNLLAG